MFREGLRPPDPFPERPATETLQTQDGMSLKSLAELGPLTVFLLPALGTADCRRMLDELAGGGEKGRRLVLVHMGADEEARAALEPLDLHYLARIADPGRALYRELGVEETSPGKLARALGARPVQKGGVVRIPS